MNTILAIGIVIFLLLILLEVDHFFTVRRMDKHLDASKKRFDTMRSDLDNLKNDLTELDGIQNELEGIYNNLRTS